MDFSEFVKIFEDICEKIGEADGKEVAKKDNEFIDYIESLLSEIDLTKLPLITEQGSNNECPVNQELILKLKELDQAKNCFPCPNDTDFNLCKQPYALCTSAKCLRLKKSQYVVCYCDVLKGCSFGTEPCESLKPFKKGPLEFIFSTYNPIQTASNCETIQTYPNPLNPSMEFANCLNQICIRDPRNPLKKAFCLCPLNTADKWVTVGKDIVVNPDIYLSGASVEAFQNSADYFLSCKNIPVPGG